MPDIHLESPPDSAPAAPGLVDPRSAFLEEKAFRSRTLFLFGVISDSTAAETARRLIALASENSKPIDIIVSSPGGHLESGESIHDLIKFIDVPINMVGTGWVGSAATHIYLAAPKERRVCLPHTRFLIHQPSGGAGGQASDIAIQAREILKARERIAEVISRETGQKLERVLADIERDRWMGPEEAIEYGLVARVIRKRSELS